jgi:hypothetical protein
MCYFVGAGQVISRNVFEVIYIDNFILKNEDLQILKVFIFYPGLWDGSLLLG